MSQRLDERAAGLEAADEVEGEQPARQRHLALGQLVLGVRLQPRLAHLGDERMALEEPGEHRRRCCSGARGGRRGCAGRGCRSWRRTARRWRPGARRRSRASRPARRAPATTPRVASLCPAMALVAECTTRSTPWSSGRWTSGVAKVESTTVIGPAMAPISSRSTRSSRGLAGVSAMTSVVLPGDDRGGEGARLGGVDEGDVDAEARARRLQQQLGAGVELALGDDVVAGRAQAEHHRADGPHARGEGPGRLGPLELGDGVLEPGDGGVAVAAVEAGGARPSVAMRRPSSTVGVTNVVVAHRIGASAVSLSARPGPDGAGLGVQVGPGGPRAGGARRRGSSVALLDLARNGGRASPTASVSSRKASWPSGLEISTWAGRRRRRSAGLVDAAPAGTGGRGCRSRWRGSAPAR